MSQNAALVYRAFDAFNRRDLDAFLDLMAEDVEVRSRLVAVEGGYRGHEGVRRWWSNLLEAIPDFTAEVDVRDVGDEKDLTLVVLQNRGHGSTSDAPIDETRFMLVRWRDRKCVRWTVFSDEAEALQAAGLAK